MSDSTPTDTAALEQLKALFPAERWSKIETQARKHAIALQDLCKRLLESSLSRYPSNQEAALCSAANRLLISLGSRLSDGDVQRFEAALKPAGLPVAEEAATKKPRGGKADAAPPPSN